MDCIIHGVAKSQTQLSDFLSHIKKKKKSGPCRDGNSETTEIMLNDHSVNIYLEPH